MVERRMSRLTSVAMIVLFVVGLVGGYFIGQATYPVPERKGLTGELLIPMLEAQIWENWIPPVVDILNEEVNAYLDKVGANFTIKFVYDHAEGSAARTLEMIEEYHTAGAEVIIGSSWSSHCMQALPYCNENHVLLFSPCATSTLLGIPNDNLYRFVANDSLQGVCIAHSQKTFGIESFVALYPGDAWGRGLMEDTTKYANALDISVYESIEYPLDSDFIGEARILNDLVSEAIGIYGKDKVAVLFLGYKEVTDVPCMQQSESYPLLSEVLWFSGDASVNSGGLSNFAEFGEKVRLIGPHPWAEYSANWIHFESLYVDKTGLEPWPYCAAYYDCGWIITLCILQTQKYDADAIREILPFVCNRYYGARGWGLLNSAGDLMFVDYKIVCVLNGTWADVGYFHSSTTTFEWYVDPETLRPT